MQINITKKNMRKCAIMTIFVVVAMLVLSAIIMTSGSASADTVTSTTYKQLCMTKYNVVHSEENFKLKNWNYAGYDDYDYLIGFFYDGNERFTSVMRREGIDYDYYLQFGARETEESKYTRFIMLGHCENSVDYVTDFEQTFVRYDMGVYLVIRANKSVFQFLSTPGMSNDFSQADVMLSYDKGTREYNLLMKLLFEGVCSSYVDTTVYEDIAVEEYLYCYKEMEAPVKEGYNFTGWYYDEACTQPYRGEAITDDVKLYAGFEKKKFKVVFDGSGIVDPEDPNTQGLYDWTSEVEYGEVAVYDKDNHAMGLPNIDELENVRFAGWFFENGAKYEDTPIYENTTLYGRFYCTVSFDLNGGIGELESIDVAYGTQIDLPAPTREKYGFDYWSQDGAVFTSDMFVKEDMTLVAEWYRNVFNVTFYVDNEVWKEVEVELGQSLFGISEELEVNVKSVIGFENLNKTTNAVSFKEYKVEDDMAVYLSDKFELPQDPSDSDKTTSNVFAQLWNNVKVFFDKVAQWFKDLFGKLKIK